MEAWSILALCSGKFREQMRAEQQKSYIQVKEIIDYTH